MRAATLRSASVSGLGLYLPRARALVEAVPDYERRLTLMLFVVAPILQLLIRFGLGSQHAAQSVVKGWDDLVILCATLVAVPSLPARVSALRNGWIGPVALALFALVMGIKVAAVDWPRVDFFWETLGMELKPIYYLVAAAAIYLRIGRLHLEHWLGRFVFFACMMVLSYLIQIAMGLGTLARAQAVEEANYDGFILGMGLLICYHLRDRVSKYAWAILLLATVLTLSRTGMAALLLIAAIICVRHRRFGWLVAGAVALVPAAIAIYVTRANGASSNQFDRFRMWQSFFLTVRHWSPFEWMFGMMPGVPIRYYDPYIQFFIDFQSVGAHGLAGLHPFNYHGMHIRYIITWGLLGVAIALVAMALSLRRGGWLLGLLWFYILIQGVSMGVIYLTTVAVPTLLMVFELWMIGADRWQEARAPRPA